MSRKTAKCDLLEAVENFEEDKARKVLKLLQQNAYVVEKKIKFCDHDFRIEDTKDWKIKEANDGIVIAEAPWGGAWEYRGGVPEELVGKQLFNWWSAMAVTEATPGIHIPSDKEFDRIEKKDIPNLVFAGYRSIGGLFSDLSTSGYFWTSLESGSDAWYRGLGSSYATVYRYTSTKAYGSSVRCVKD